MDFWQCVFAGNAEFGSAKIGGMVDFSTAVINGNTYFTKAEIGSDARFIGTQARGALYFNRAKVRGEADFSGTKFGGEADFSGTKFGGEADFSSTTISGNARFRVTRFARRVCFSLTNFKGMTDFPGVTLPPAGLFNGAVLRPGYGESFCRFAKQVSQNMGEYRKAGDWHYEERRHALAQRIVRHKEWWRRILACLNPWYLGELIFMQGLFGYGEKPLRVVRGAVAVILTWALGFRVFGGVRLNSSTGEVLSSFWDALYFSLATFTTMGFGDFRPVTTGARLLAEAEAFSGVLMAALLAVSLAKRFSRG
jgi:voltage-gated potassium channel Kch